MPHRFKIITTQAKEEMQVAKNIYDGINNELKEELPALYDRSDSFICNV